ncbi:MAG: cupin domain-containing protein [Ignavibacteria bacterium]|nr:cupin domain-containing protein [Ignavibacteria bacterium]
MKNFFDIPAGNDFKEEYFESLFVSKSIRVEKIISKGNTTQKGKWLKQRSGEWVVLLQGKAELKFEDSSIRLNKGDALYISPNTKHRVEYTSKRPLCLWIAVHILK